MPMSPEINALSEQELAAIDREIGHAPYRSAVAVDALRIVQENRGWISDTSLQAIARHLGMSVDELEGVATFYNLIFRRPVGEQVILLCNSISCWIRGCDRLQADIRERLGIDFGQTTADERFTLLPIACLGACDRAPAMLVGDQLHGNVDSDTLGDILAVSEETPS